MLRNILILFLLFSVTSYTAAAQKKDRKKKKKSETEQVSETPGKTEYKEIGSPLPELRIITREGKELTNKDFEGDHNLLVMMFNPTCDHCQSETILLEKNIDLFKKTKLLLVAAPSMIDYLDFYNNVTRYSKYPTMKVGVDSAGYIDKTYRYEALPQINIYDKNRKLIKVFAGETSIESLKPYIE